MRKVAVAALIVGLVGLAAIRVWAQDDQRRAPGTNGYRRFYDPAVGGTAEALNLPLDPTGVNLQVGIVYRGNRHQAVPKRVEVVISSGGSLIGNARALEMSVHVEADGHAFACLTRNARDVATANAVALLCAFDQFRVLSDASSVTGEAFGIGFSIPSEGLLALRDLADRWAIPE
jgi:hypothetical protein